MTLCTIFDGIHFPFINDVYFYCWYILFDICKERYMNALILWGFVTQFIEINVNKDSRIPNEWSELHQPTCRKIKKQFGRAKRAENLKKFTFYIKFSKICKVRLFILFSSK